MQDESDNRKKNTFCDVIKITSLAFDSLAVSAKISE
jgi:hypothetical protein